MENNKEIHYRHEWKHEINWSDLISIRQRLRAVAEPEAGSARCGRQISDTKSVF